MKYNLKCSEFDPEDYREKRLVWYLEETERHLILHPFVSTDGMFALIGTETSWEKGNQIATVETQIDEGTLRRMEKPESRY